jgi:hypothetical protein
LGFQQLGGTHAEKPPFVCNNVLAGTGTALTSVITTGNKLKPYLQSYNIHTYDPVESYTDSFAAAAELAHQLSAPLWLTECGIHLPALSPAPWSDMSPATDLLQAQFIAPSFATSLYAGVSKHFFFVLSNYLERSLQYGLLRHDNTPRPGYSALAAVGYFMANASISGFVVGADAQSAVKQTIVPKRASERAGSVGGALPLAKAYAMVAKPGGGETKDVLVVYCPAGQAHCGVPPSLLAASVAQGAKVFDFLGRDMPALSANISNACVFLVLPVGTVGSKIHVVPPPHAIPIAKTRNEAPSISEPNITEVEASTVVLQSVLPYAKNLIGMDQDAHRISGNRENSIVFYAYNFGKEPVTGSVMANVNTSVIDMEPKTWAALTIPVGRRIRFTSMVTWTGSGKDAVDGIDGVVQLVFMVARGQSSGAAVAPAQLYFRLAVDLSTIKPTTVMPVVGASAPSAWTHNIAPGGTVTASAAGPGCVQFSYDFGPTVGDAWAYPQLRFNSSTRPTADTDGILVTIKVLGVTPPIDSSMISHTALFWDSNNTQYGLEMRTNESDYDAPQEMTLLLRDSAWDHIGHGPRPLDPDGPIAAVAIAQLALGVNLKANNHVYKMAICDLSWARWKSDDLAIKMDYDEASPLQPVLRSETEYAGLSIQNQRRNFQGRGTAMKLDGGQKLLHFNNDLTNMLSCISPFHPSVHTPFSTKMLHRAVNETRGLGISRHVMAPGLCSVPWYPSKLLPPTEYKRWFNAMFQVGTTGNGFMDFAVGGGDLLADFATVGAADGEQPGISFRVQDIQALNRAPTHNYGNLDQFWFEKRHDPTALISGEPFPDDCCWKDSAFCLNSSNSIARRKTYCNPDLLGAMNWANPVVLAHHKALMVEVAVMHPHLTTLELDFLRMPLLFNVSQTSLDTRCQLMRGLFQDLRQAIPPSTKLALRIPANRELLSEIGLSRPSEWVELVEYVQAGTDFYSKLASDTEFEWLRAQIPEKTPLLWEITSMSHPMQPHGNCQSGQDMMTAEQLRTYSLDAYALGADGVSAFNFHYWRPTGNEAQDICEGTPLESGLGSPLFSVLPGLKDPAWLRTQDQHYAWSTNWASHPPGEGNLLTPNISIGRDVLGLQQFPYASIPQQQLCTPRHRGWAVQNQYPCAVHNIVLRIPNSMPLIRVVRTGTVASTPATD